MTRISSRLMFGRVQSACRHLSPHGALGGEVTLSLNASAWIRPRMPLSPRPRISRRKSSHARAYPRGISMSHSLPELCRSPSCAAPGAVAVGLRRMSVPLFFGTQDHSPGRPWATFPDTSALLPHSGFHSISEPNHLSLQRRSTLCTCFPAAPCGPTQAHDEPHSRD